MNCKLVLAAISLVCAVGCATLTQKEPLRELAAAAPGLAAQCKPMGWGHIQEYLNTCDLRYDYSLVPAQVRHQDTSRTNLSDVLV